PARTGQGVVAVFVGTAVAEPGVDLQAVAGRRQGLAGFGGSGLCPPRRGQHGAREQARQGQSQGHVLKPSFQRRSSAKVSTRSRGGRPKRAAIASRIVSLSTRRNGLAARSPAIVAGRVGSPRSRWLAASALRACSAGLSASAAAANAALGRVYSCPQQTRV